MIKKYLYLFTIIIISSSIYANGLEKEETVINYNLNFYRYRETSLLYHNINLLQPFSNKFFVEVAGADTSDYNAVLNRDKNICSNAIGMRFIPTHSISTKFGIIQSKTNDNRLLDNPLSSNFYKSSINSKNIFITSSLKKSNIILISATISKINEDHTNTTHQQLKSSFNNDGNSQNIHLRISSPNYVDWINANLNYNGNRIVKKRTDYVKNKINILSSKSIYRNTNISLSTSYENLKERYPSSINKEKMQNEIRRKDNAEILAKLENQIQRNAFLSFSYSYHSGALKHNLKDSPVNIIANKDRSENGQSLNADINYKFRSIDLTSSLQRERNFYEYSDSLALDYTNDRKRFASSIVFNPYKRYRLSFIRTIELISYIHKNESPTKLSTIEDRDQLLIASGVLSNYEITPSLEINLLFNVYEDRLSYISKYRSANNRDKIQYNLSPSLIYSSLNGLVIRQIYTLKSTYTVYSFDSNKNMIYRMSGISDSISYKLSDKTSIGFACGFTREDNGKYKYSEKNKRWEYEKKNKKDEQIFEFSSGLKLSKALYIIPSYRIRIINNQSIFPDEMRLSPSGISENTISLITRYSFDKGIITSSRNSSNKWIYISAKRITRNDQKDYWDVSASLSYSL